MLKNLTRYFRQDRRCKTNELRILSSRCSRQSKEHIVETETFLYRQDSIARDTIPQLSWSHGPLYVQAKSKNIKLVTHKKNGISLVEIATFFLLALSLRLFPLLAQWANIKLNKIQLKQICHMYNIRFTTIVSSIVSKQSFYFYSRFSSNITLSISESCMNSVNS